MIQRALNRWAQGVPIPVTGVYDQTTSDRVMAFQAAEGITPASGELGQRTLDALWPYFDRYGRWRYRLFRPPAKPKVRVPDLGPVVPGGRSVLDHDLTHETKGLPGYPAFDDGFRAGVVVIAPEPLVVTRIGTTVRRDGRRNGLAVYARGDALDWWFGHVDHPVPVGTRLERGARLAVVSANHESPHVHVGISAERLLGAELEHRRDYRHGAATVGAQLRRALA
jgi:peptidoglycan hydrolase-like protein with peptidoglycan-binding domain